MASRRSGLFDQRLELLERESRPTWPVIHLTVLPAWASPLARTQTVVEDPSMTDDQDRETTSSSERMKLQRVSVGVPGFRATADRGTTLGRAARISVLGLTLDYL